MLNPADHRFVAELAAGLPDGTIRAAVAHALGVSATQALHLSVANLGLTRLEREPTGWRVVCVNELPGY